MITGGSVHAGEQMSPLEHKSIDSICEYQEGSNDWIGKSSEKKQTSAESPGEDKTDNQDGNETPRGEHTRHAREESTK